jgi:hypothetical protein
MTTSTAAVPWSARAAALLEVAGELGARAASTGDARRRTALLGLHCLAAFATKQFHLFEKGFTGGMLQADAAMPPEYVLEATARQVGFDIDVMLRSMGQREPSISTAAMRETLDLADKLAADALAGAVRSRLIEETAVLTYFQKTPTIRLLPYVPLALLGIDLTAIQDRAQLLAIAHETGHHVYRQLTTNYTVEPQKKAEKRALVAPAQFPAWLTAWAEEVFADIYSVLVAGPVAGVSIQAMLMGELPGVLLQDDADHPLPALRPEIAVAVLRKLAGEGKHGSGRLAQAADLQEQQWQGYLKLRKVGDTFTPAGGGQPVPLGAARAQLEAYVGYWLDGLLAPLARDAKAARWSSGETAPELYDQFAKTCAGLAGTRAPELESVGDKVAVTPQVAGVHGGQRVVGEIGDPYLDELRSHALAGKRTLTVAEWQAVFIAGDWVTEEGGSGILPVK